NVARVAYRLGSTVAAIYPTGGAIGKLLHRLVEREGIASLQRYSILAVLPSANPKAASPRRNPSK
ncbi:MAG: hypothetical protein WCD87_05050, partial [Pseudolabrys sp.]